MRTESKPPPFRGNVVVQPPSKVTVVLRQAGDAAGAEIARFELAGTPVVLGKADDCDVSIPETSVSGHHARLSLRDGTVFVEDLGSTNGTTVNGQSITGVQPLTSGDSLQLGAWAVEIRTEMPVVPISVPAQSGGSPLVGREARRKSKTVAELLAFLFAPFAIHQLYIGNTRRALWRLGITIGGVVIGHWVLGSDGIVTATMGIVLVLGIVDFFKMMRMTNDDFHAMCVRNREVAALSRYRLHWYAAIPLILVIVVGLFMGVMFGMQCNAAAQFEPENPFERVRIAWDMLFISEQNPPGASAPLSHVPPADLDPSYYALLYGYGYRVGSSVDGEKRERCLRLRQAMVGELASTAPALSAYASADEKSAIGDGFVHGLYGRTARFAPHDEAALAGTPIDKKWRASQHPADKPPAASATWGQEDFTPQNMTPQDFDAVVNKADANMLDELRRAGANEAEIKKAAEDLKRQRAASRSNNRTYQGNMDTLSSEGSASPSLDLDRLRQQAAAAEEARKTGIGGFYTGAGTIGSSSNR